MSEQFKWCLYLNCSPTLQKIKPSNIFTLHKSRYPNWKQDLTECRSTLLRHGFNLIVLQENDRFVIVMVYHPAVLQHCLNQKDLSAYLQSMGYRPTLPLDAKLSLLGQRFHQDSFPHEIGLFLGYPIDDVTGFIANHGKNSKYTGDWKVYGDVSRAKMLFQAYRASRSSIFDKARRGAELEDILCTC